MSVRELLSTVSVIHMLNIYTVLSVISWPDTFEGNEKAEQYFIECAQENTDLDDTQIQKCLEDGIVEVGEGSIIIHHS